MSWRDGPLLFLDIDGVLNSHDWAQRAPALGRRAYVDLDPVAVAELQRIVVATDCALVLSSTWRRIHGLADVRGLMVAAGWQGRVPLHDKTPYLPGALRGTEVNVWRVTADHKAAYVCVDDDSDFLPGQPLVRTTTARGLTATEADAAIAVLQARA